MTSRTLSRAAMVFAAAAILIPACIGDSVTAPEGPDLGKGKQPTQSTNVTLVNLEMQSTTLTIGGDAVPYTVDIVNSGRKRTVVTLQGTIVMSNGNDRRAAGGTEVLCGAAGGTLPHGTCNMGFTAQASNSTGGQGTLVAGPALFTAALLDSEGGLLASIQVPVTLQ